MVRQAAENKSQNNVLQHKIMKTLSVSSSTVHNTFKGVRGYEEISQGQKSIVDTRELQALRRHCSDSEMEITAWTQEQLQKLLSVSTAHCVGHMIHRQRWADAHCERLSQLLTSTFTPLPPPKVFKLINLHRVTKCAARGWKDNIFHY